MILIANGQCNHVDPLARMSCTSATFAKMTAMVMAVADEVCDGRVVAMHEGGYSEAYVPFCGHAVVEQLAGIDTGLSDPFLPKFMEQQPTPDHVAWQCADIDRMAKTLGLCCPGGTGLFPPVGGCLSLGRKSVAHSRASRRQRWSPAATACPQPGHSCG